MTKDLRKANLGKAFEQTVSMTNEMYKIRKVAFVVKNDAEWKVLFSYKNGYRVPRKAWKPEKGFVDYIGIMEGGIPFCFDAKSTEQETRFPLSNVADHQIVQMGEFAEMGGIAFLLVHFDHLHETYILSLDDLEQFHQTAKQGGRKSIPYRFFADHCTKVEAGNGLALDYLAALRRDGI